MLADRIRVSVHNFARVGIHSDRQTEEEAERLARKPHSERDELEKRPNSSKFTRKIIMTPTVVYSVVEHVDNLRPRVRTGARSIISTTSIQCAPTGRVTNVNRFGGPTTRGSNTVLSPPPRSTTWIDTIGNSSRSWERAAAALLVFFASATASMSMTTAVRQHFHFGRRER